MADGLQRLGVDWPSLVAYLINFALLLVLLNYVAYRPALRALERRRAAAAEAARGLERVRQEADAGQRAADRLRDAARERARAELAQARSAAIAEMRRARAQAERVAREYVERARHTIEAERRRAVSEVRSDTAEFVVNASAAVLARALDEEEHARLVRLATEEVERLPAGTLGGRRGSALVTSARRLTEAEGAAVVAALARATGVRRPVMEREDPAVLGGMVIRVGDAEIDASLQGRIARLGRDLAGDAGSQAQIPGAETQ
jgi:F-type H+-transporting ATPase subunit b